MELADREADMKQHPADSEAQTAQPASTDQPNADRRRFVVAGIVAAPLLVTLSARPAFARQTGTLGAYGSVAP
jgi:hypothetical protein